MFNFKYYLKDNWEAFHGCSCKCFQRKLSHLLEDKMRGKHLSLIWEQYVITWNTECIKKVLKWRTYFSSFKWNASYLAHKLNIFRFLLLQTDSATESLSWVLGLWFDWEMHGWLLCSLNLGTSDLNPLDYWFLKVHRLKEGYYKN